MEIRVCGKLLGECGGWDQSDTFTVLFTQCSFNDNGLKFLDPPIGMKDTIKKATDLQLLIDFESGVVGLYIDQSSEPYTADPDWSVLNKTDEDTE